VVIALRAYLRQRLMLISLASMHIQHMQKALEQMNVKLTEDEGDRVRRTDRTITGQTAGPVGRC